MVVLQVHRVVHPIFVGCATRESDSAAVFTAAAPLIRHPVAFSEALKPSPSASTSTSSTSTPNT